MTFTPEQINAIFTGFGVVITAIGAIFGSYKGIIEWQKARDNSRVASLEGVVAEYKKLVEKVQSDLDDAKKSWNLERQEWESRVQAEREYWRGVLENERAVSSEQRQQDHKKNADRIMELEVRISDLDAKLKILSVSEKKNADALDVLSRVIADFIPKMPKYIAQIVDAVERDALTKITLDFGNDVSNVYRGLREGTT